MKKVYFPIDYSHGGGSTFIRYLVEELKNTEFEAHCDYDMSVPDVYFAIGAETDESKIPYLREKQNQGMKIFYRLDGITTTRMPSGLDRMKTMHTIADVVVYQSNFIKVEAEKLFGEHKNSKVIYNGVDTQKFYISIDWPTRDFLISEWSQNPCKKIQESLGLLQKYLGKVDPNAKITIVGKFQGDWINQNFGFRTENCKYLPRLSYEEMPKLYQDHKVLVMANENEACSNSALEAMACGTIVVYKNSGSMLDLCQTQVLWDDTENCLQKAISRSNTTKRYLGREIVQKQFDLRVCLNKYLEELRACLD